MVVRPVLGKKRRKKKKKQIGKTVEGGREWGKLQGREIE